MDYGKWAHLRTLNGRIADLIAQRNALSDEAVLDCKHLNIIAYRDGLGSSELCTECGLLTESGGIPSSVSRELVSKEDFDYRMGALGVPVRGPSPLHRN